MSREIPVQIVLVPTVGQPQVIQAGITIQGEIPVVLGAHVKCPAIRCHRQRKEAMKTLNNKNVEGAKSNASDLEVFGDGDMFKLLCKASSESEGWMKSTKAMEVEGVGCVVQITTQQRNPDGSWSVAEACCFVPGVDIIDELDDAENVVARHLE